MRSLIGERSKHLARIERAVFTASVRLRLSRVLQLLPICLTLVFSSIGLGMILKKTLPSSLVLAYVRWGSIAVWGSSLLVLLVAFLRRLPDHAGGLALDVHHELDGRVSNALAFLKIDPKKRSPFMDLAIEDACLVADRLRPAQATPFRVPKGFLELLVLIPLTLAVVLLQVKRPASPTLVAAPMIDAATLSPDDLELFRKDVSEHYRDETRPEVRAAVERFNQLLDDLGRNRLDRTEAFRRLDEILRELEVRREGERKALEEALRDTGEQLKKSQLSKDVGKALSEQEDLAQARDRLKELARKLRTEKPDKAELERLRRALEAASKRNEDALKAVNDKRAELREQLLKKKGETKPNSTEERLLKKKERELERLDREAEQKEQASRKLDRLDRELSKAAEDLLRDLGASAEDLEQAAEDINRINEESLSEKEKQELKQKLEELRELLRQQGQGGKERAQRLMRFGKKARGSSGGDGGEQEGDAEKAKGGEGKDGSSETTFVLGPDGKKIPVLMNGGSTSGGSQRGGEGEKGTGKEAGSGHDNSIGGKRTNPTSSTQDVQAAGIDSGAGPSRSEAIHRAAERGFQGADYKNVFTQYHTVAEEQMTQEKIPDGYRFYIHRYFQLIRPRE